MDIPSSTPFPLLTFQSTTSADSPAALRDFLLQTIADNQSNSPYKVKHPHLETWLPILSGLSDYVLSSFPSIHAGTWDILHEKAVLVNATVDVFRLFLQRFVSLFDSDLKVAHKTIIRLINLSFILDSRDDGDVLVKEDIPTPKQLREKCLTVATEIMRYLGDNTSSEDTEAPTWDAFRSVYARCIHMGEAVVNGDTTLTFPLELSPLEEPYVREISVIPDKADVEDAPSFFLNEPTDIIALLCLFFDFLIRSLSPLISSQLHHADLIHQLTRLMHTTFNLSASERWPILPAPQAGYLIRLYLGVKSLAEAQGSSLHNAVCRDLGSRLLLHRLRSRYTTSEDAVLRTLLDESQELSMNADTIAILTSISHLEISDETGVSLALTYVSRIVPVLDRSTLDLVKSTLSSNAFREIAHIELDAIEHRLIELTSASVDSSTSPPASHPSRTERSRALLLSIFPEDSPWIESHLEGNASLPATEICRFIQERIVQRSFAGYDFKQRISVLNGLAQLACLLAHNGGSACSRPAGKDLPLLLAYKIAIRQVLQGSADEVTAAVHKAGNEALRLAVQHHSADFELGILDDLVGEMHLALSHKDRTVRLSAGHVLAEIISLYHDVGKVSWVRAEKIFGKFYSLLEGARDSIRETVLITVGRIGRVTTANFLGVAISCLISQLANPNPALKGIAYMQLMALSKFYGKTPYRLLDPYMGDIARFLVNHWPHQPALLLETCRFMSQEPSEFIASTMVHTLPSLFASCNKAVIEKIAQALDMLPSALFLNTSKEILAQVLLLPDQDQTDRALDFILQFMPATSGGSINAQTLIRSCIVELLGTFVFMLGSEDPKKPQEAMQALRKVENMLPSGPSKGRKKAPSADGVGQLLNANLLGLISYLVDMLQEVQGKQTMTSKQQTLRGLGALVALAGSDISFVAPQIMATLQVMISVEELSDVTLDAWFTFLKTMNPPDALAQAGPTSASLLTYWQSFSPRGQDTAKNILHHLVLDLGRSDDPDCLCDVADLSSVPALLDVREAVRATRREWSLEQRIHKLLDRISSDNLTVTLQALKEFKALLSKQKHVIQNFASGNTFDPSTGRMLRVLSSVAARDAEGMEEIRLLAFECLGAVGALDPDRFDFGASDPRIIVLKDYTDEEESILFAIHLIKDVLVSAFRSTSDMGYQTNLAYAIQELLKFCQFNSLLASSGRYTTSASLKTRARWDNLPKHVLETITPLLESRYRIKEKPLPTFDLPIYPQNGTYREWLQQWTTSLISEVKGEAQKVFHPFRSVVRNKDVGVAHHLLPHLVLHVLISGGEDTALGIRSEIMAVLQDQVNEQSSSSADKKLFSAQAVFLLLDHLNSWVRLTRKNLNDKKGEAKRARGGRSTVNDQLTRIDSVLSNINQDLMAKAAFQCKAYARSLMSFERHIASLQGRQDSNAEVQACYERLHEIYCNIDEPDGMEGVSTLILSPSLEHQIRQHESTGKWTSAQSCWELRLQQSPDSLDYHIGLLRCLRNLGHYDTLRTHVKGVLTRNPEWKQSLSNFEVESAWMVGDWRDVQALIDESEASTPSTVIARLLLAIREGDSSAIADAFSQARMVLGSPITASGGREYRRTYDAVLDLHLVHEVEMIHQMASAQSQLTPSKKGKAFNNLTKLLSVRLDSTLPSFRTREPILSMRRTAYGINSRRHNAIAGEISRSWLISAKIARKAGHWQTAYSAMLHAEQSRSTFSVMQKVRLTRATGEPLRALQELEHHLQMTRLQDGPFDSEIIDLTEPDNIAKPLNAKAELLRARWMNESERYEVSEVNKAFQHATELWPKWESGMFYYGKYQDDCFNNIPTSDPKIRGLRMRLSTVRCFTKAMKYGTKFIYQTVPRLLTLWLDMGEDTSVNQHECFTKINAEIHRTISGVAVIKWYTAFPQIASRVGHVYPPVYEVLAQLILTVIKAYPHQTLWLFASVVKSRNSTRESRGRTILERLKASCNNEAKHVPGLVNASLAMINALLGLCDFPPPEPPRNGGLDAKLFLSMKKDIPQLAKLTPSPLIVPLQESLTAKLPPPTSAVGSDFKPFEDDAPTFHGRSPLSSVWFHASLVLVGFSNEIEVMRSLAKPRKITIHGSNGQTYAFLGKPRDDLRKDARLMDFNSLINKLLNTNSDSRRRQLYIRTYGVVTLNEECGFIQWVPDTIAMRYVLLPLYDAKGTKGWGADLQAMFDRIKRAPDNEVAKIFVNEVLPKFEPVFHEWFLETFPEPSAWLASRLAYGRTAAVMSMVGYILGHCENILLDTNTGSVVHVDFNCLFDKGKALEVPERVPFRLTQNIVDGLGVAGAEGVFRIACEITMGLLRENKDTLMTVLDAFIHDPLVEWEDEKRKLEQASRRNQNQPRTQYDLRQLARSSLDVIEKKLKGLYKMTRGDRVEKEMSTSNLVQMLIQEATDSVNLGKMYPGWAPWH
ncbi:hypothetical protein BC834DRAFT_678146 [Gloeopeniophorella convolvens]|nr:hypothetical protein BC834DRAFT_678146 [Gloeopeniophorella convolvens]